MAPGVCGSLVRRRIYSPINFLQSLFSRLDLIMRFSYPLIMAFSLYFQSLREKIYLINRNSSTRGCKFQMVVKGTWPPIFHLAMLALCTTLSACSHVSHRDGVSQLGPSGHHLSLDGGYHPTAKIFVPAVETHYTETDNIWERLRARFQFDVDTDNPRVQRYIKYYSDNPEILRRLTARAEPYLYYR